MFAKNTGRKSLFVIGNGFDIDHNLETSYENFHSYLKNKYTSANESKYDLSHVTIKRGDKIAPDDVINVSTIMRMISLSEAKFKGINYEEMKEHDIQWSQMEKILGQLTFDELLCPIDEYRNLDTFKIEKIKCYNEHVIVLLKIVFLKFHNYFAEWVKQIDIARAIYNQDLSKVIKESDLFFNFNYTKTLEDIYRVEDNNICYIHGCMDDNDDEIIFGHGRNDELIEVLEEKYLGVGCHLSNFFDRLEKYPTTSFYEHEDFFDKINKNVRQIYSFGFSYEEVDLFYIKEICKRISLRTIWYVHNYKNEDTKKYIKKIRKCGFKGRIRKFRNWSELNKIGHE